MSCKNICQQLAERKFKVPSPYQNGFRYCRRCEVYMQTDRRFCECCGMTLRYTPVKPEAKIILRAK